MSLRLQFLLLFTITFSTYNFAQHIKFINGKVNDNNLIVISINHDIHDKYGCLYPITYLINIPPGLRGLTVHRKYVVSENWSNIQEKTTDDYFNAIEAVRFDYDSGKVYLSTAFSEMSDTIYIQLTDAYGNIVSSNYGNICKYYDNRTAAVTITSDDWYEATAAKKEYIDLLNLFRSHHLYITLAVITRFNSTSPVGWANLQKLIDSGFVEVASHSQIHTYLPYANYQGEVIGSYDDIVNYLNLPPLFKFKSNKQFVYSWIAPGGVYDNMVDSLLQFRSYLILRLDNWSSKVPNDEFSQWNPNYKHFDVINADDEVGLINDCGKDTSYNELKIIFDSTITSGKIYHLQWHPQWLYMDLTKPYLNDFLDYMSNRKNIWYVNLGHLYLYHYLQGEDSLENINPNNMNAVLLSLQMYQNYPNPFNLITTISFSVSYPSYVTLKIYDVLGRELAILADGYKTKGFYKSSFNASRLPSGVYIYQLKSGNFIDSKKMVLIK
jgi:hypothetical protein